MSESTHNLIHLSICLMAKRSLDLGLYSAGNYRPGHLPRRGLVDFTRSQISPITL